LTRAYPLSWGAQVSNDGVRFKLWAPAARKVFVAIVEPAERIVPMEPAGLGWYEVTDRDCSAGARYFFEIDGTRRVPDPAARFAPDGPAAASEVIDPSTFRWPERKFPPSAEAMVFYELHVGTFTPSGTYAEAAEHLDHLIDLGVTAVELMPLAERPGARNWGYDGVLWYAPAHRYGRPDDLKTFIAAAHSRGLSVLLDVVYNHFGPQDNYLGSYAPEFFTKAHHTPWGNAIDYGAANNEPVRRFAIENACYWLSEYDFDGLRLDATQEIYDDSATHILRELAMEAHRAKDRPVYLVVENDENDPRAFERGYDAQWNDDVHHAVHVALTGEGDGYYEDFTADPVGLLGRALTQGFAFQGEPSAFRGGRRRGGPTGGVALSRFINFLQNHDQIGNRAFGERITALASPEAVRAALVTMLLAPSPPLLFMGEEWAASAPFLYFCDFEPGLSKLVTEGRRKEFARFARFADPAARERIPDPSSPATFERSILDWSELEQPQHRRTLELYRELLRIRRAEIVPRIADLTGRAARYERQGDRGLRCTWRLADDAVLVLEANFASRSQAGFGHRGAGKELYATAPFIGGQAPPWSARWSLAP
jgi:maltooligosyltrehalose trehalohydrolase